jgi:hypothetical protein
MLSFWLKAKGLDMKFRHLTPVVCVIALAGCDRYAAGELRQLQEMRSEAGDIHQFSVSNYWTLTMPGASIATRYERARNACMTDRSLNCKLASANVRVATDGGSGSFANLSVLLPHSKVELFKHALLAPVANEASNAVSINEVTTSAENVQSESDGANRKVEQLKTYLDRLTALAKRPNLSIEDTIRLEAEISRVQGELNTAQTAKDNVDGRVAREYVMAELREIPRGPIASVLNRASDIFVDNIANVLSFLIGVIPWLPIIAIVIFAGRWLWRVLARKKRTADI